MRNSETNPSGEDGDHHEEGTDQAKDTEAEEALQLNAQGRRVTTTTHSQTIHWLRRKSVRGFLTTYTPLALIGRSYEKRPP